MFIQGSTCWGWVLGIVIGGASTSIANCALAQVTPDGTLPNNSTITQEGNTSTITGGTKAGGNLFHSFREFSVPTNGTAYFNNAVDIQNIISRVTGKSISNIDGLIKANGIANLFLINPNGIIFGQNARLDIGGSFVASTASSMKFADGFEFSAAAPQEAPLLTISVPIGLQFGINPGSIQAQGDGQGTGKPGQPPPQTENALRVPSNQTLALVGGDVSLQGATLKTEGGRIELGSVAGNSQVSLIPVNKGFALGYGGVQNFRNIQLSQSATVDTSGAGGGDIQLQGRDVTLTDNSAIFGYTLGNENGGDVSIRAKDLIVRDGSLVVVSSSGSGKAGNLNVSASNLVEISGGENNDLPGGLYTQGYGNGTSGNLTINTGKLIVSNGAQVSSSSFSKEPAGNLKVSASEFVKLVGTADDFFTSSLSTESYGNGTSGNLTIYTGKLIISDGAQVTTSARGEGLGGNLTVRASESIELTGSSDFFVSGLFSQTSNNGAALNLTIDTGKLIVRDGARISTSSSAERTRLFVTVYPPEKLVTATSLSVLPRGIFTKRSIINFSTNTIISTETANRARNIRNRASQTGDLDQDRGFEDKIFSTNGSFLSYIHKININSNNSGKAGNLVVTASDFVELVGTTPNVRFPISSGLFTDTSSRGDAGNLTINTNKLIISNGAEATVSSTGQGAAGNLNVTANSVSLNNGKITSQTRFGNGGNLKLNVANLLLMRHGSEISTTAGTAQQPGDGGNITINAPNGFIIAKPGENSDITANALNGSGGRITINATGIFGIAPLTRQELERLRPNDLDPSKLQTNDITAISQTNPSLSGTIQLNTPDIDLNSALINLPSVPVDTQVAQSCTAGGTVAQSQFTITGRGGLPPNPGEALNTDAVQVDLMTLNPEVNKPSTPAVSINPISPTPDRIVEATGWVINANGNVIFTADAPTVTPHSSWQRTADCRA
ncbi:MAG: S-layer family protein [Iphinoe sp. HA4291-MV1]|jgi:filamentous hemagglutinin family protein|nr:S-layer family protein [Iphinoe sp. HA4291-MV1]